MKKKAIDDAHFCCDCGARVYPVSPGGRPKLRCPGCYKAHKRVTWHNARLLREGPPKPPAKPGRKPGAASTLPPLPRPRRIFTDHAPGFAVSDPGWSWRSDPHWPAARIVEPDAAAGSIAVSIGADQPAVTGDSILID